MCEFRGEILTLEISPWVRPRRHLPPPLPCCSCPLTLFPEIDLLDPSRRSLGEKKNYCDLWPSIAKYLPISNSAVADKLQKKCHIDPKENQTILTNPESPTCFKITLPRREKKELLLRNDLMGTCHRSSQGVLQLVTGQVARSFP